MNGRFLFRYTALDIPLWVWLHMFLYHADALNQYSLPLRKHSKYSGLLSLVFSRYNLYSITPSDFPAHNLYFLDKWGRIPAVAQTRD